MEWEVKIDLVRLGNKRYENGGMERFHNFVLENIEEFDVQSVDMFLTIITITKDEVAEYIEFWKKVWPYIKKMDDTKLSLRPAIRYDVLEMICEEQLKIK